LKDGFIKTACGTFPGRLADCRYNAGEIVKAVKTASRKGASLLILPELCITGYTCGDLFQQETLLSAAEEALSTILRETAGEDIVTAAGLPIAHDGRLYNCAAVFKGGKILGIAVKANIPNYGEFYEKRQFFPAPEEAGTIDFCGQKDIPFGSGLVFEDEEKKNFSFGIEICEDLWVPHSPSVGMCASGALIIGNLSASNEIIGKDAYRKELVSQQSAKLLCGYVYADAGESESTADVVFCAHNIIAENGTIIAENRFSDGLTVSEIDVDKLAYERRRTQVYARCPSKPVEKIPFDAPLKETELTRYIAPNPFAPEDASDREKRCSDIMRITSAGLRRRLEHTGAKKAVIGLSGGLDSTLAAMITARALEEMGRASSDMLAVTMPCFGTTEKTKDNAVILAEELGADLRTIDIKESVDLHLRDIGHDDSLKNNAYENAQARERTQILMDIANDVGGIVVGTGDLSELALGWCTYNGDHMSMYGVNCSIPKSLVRYVVGYTAASEREKGRNRLADVLEDILGTPVSPELLPAVDGEISQKTEDIIGPYDMHDFFLYYTVRWGFSPLKVYRLACYAMKKKYDRKTIAKWIRVFYRRFFTQQFKRDCLPDGPKVGSVALSPRGDWRMPSDASMAEWKAQLDEIDASLK
jgi:NAD+ synthase (glutamine-hydrolysing)